MSRRDALMSGQDALMSGREPLLPGASSTSSLVVDDLHDQCVLPFASVPTGLLAADGRHRWFPVSPCGSGCIAVDDAGALLPSIATALRVTSRMVAFGALLAVLAVLAPLVAVCPRMVRRRSLRVIARSVLVTLGIRVEIDDHRPFAGHARGLVVANHVSYLDIVAIATVHPSHFVAKSEVITMPGIGLLARRLGVIGVERASLRSLPAAIDDVIDRLHRDTSVAVFPEGTTRCGRTSGRVAPAFFEAAVRARVPVVPMRLDYRLEPRRGASEASRAVGTAAAYIGDDTVGDTFRRVLRARGLTVVVGVHESRLPGPGRRELARDCEPLIVKPAS